MRFLEGGVRVFHRGGAEVRVCMGWREVGLVCVCGGGYCVWAEVVKCTKFVLCIACMHYLRVLCKMDQH